MTDAGRKDFSTKAKESIIPDSTKSTHTKAKEDITDAGDKVVRGIQPDGSKSHTQEASDKIGRSKDRNEHGTSGGGIGEKIKDALHINKK
ncbi:putative chaperone/heat shock protein Hsp12 [Pseudovirgaria hyperparasitica]|uniref:Putative chaperone/heat shock protein Hsp12 n=1 Tax=Pseudovirgaria hyperparasitica TaxID=470096 RepID=A0A6A6WFI9_9PEZI|nr:putative chaperone/heat shock protein Hsp12 [Pseudovirgaria hyperparasitica]KAF2760814.1 putative chaperone/heat shock protein Hsp12 [Pseudovirgaria hyperparasitica]